MNPNGSLVIEWGSEVASKQVSIDCAAGDYDSDGGVWLFVKIHPVGVTTGGSLVSWQIKDLGMSFDAEAVAPPQAVMLEEKH
jgi:hypothetical protein